MTQLTEFPSCVIILITQEEGDISMSTIIWILAIAIVLLAAFLCGRACDNLAQYKGYGGSAFWVGFFCGVPALIYYAGLPISESMTKSRQDALAESIAAAMGSVDAPKPGAGNTARSNAVPYSTAPSSQTARSTWRASDTPKPTHVEYAIRVPVESRGIYSDNPEIYCSECGNRQPANWPKCWKCGRTFKNEE